MGSRHMTDTTKCSFSEVREIDLDAEIPRRIKTLRTGLGISAAGLDQMTGFNAGTTGRLERGDQRVYATHLHRICAVTGISIGYFYALADDDPEDPAAPSGHTIELETQRLLQAYMQIQDPRLKRDVFELVETLANEYGAEKD